jgi:hypothetical protein
MQILFDLLKVNIILNLKIVSDCYGRTNSDDGDDSDDDDGDAFEVRM